MKANIIVDTSAWIEYFNKADSEIGKSVEEMLRAGKVCGAGIILTELLQGAKIEKEFDSILESFIALPFLDSSLKTWIRSGRISFSLRRKGITIPTTDLIIAGLALEHHVSIFTLDPHFEKIPDLTLIH